MKTKQILGILMLSILFLLLFIAMAIDSSFTTALAVWGSAILLSSTIVVGITWCMGGSLRDLFN